MFVTLWDRMCDLSATAFTLLCAAHAMSIHSQHMCVVDQKNLRHFASARLTCMGTGDYRHTASPQRVTSDQQWNVDEDCPTLGERQRLGGFAGTIGRTGSACAHLSLSIETVSRRSPMSSTNVLSARSIT